MNTEKHKEKQKSPEKENRLTKDPIKPAPETLSEGSNASNPPSPDLSFEFENFGEMDLDQAFRLFPETFISVCVYSDKLSHNQVKISNSTFWAVLEDIDSTAVKDNKALVLIKQGETYSLKIAAKIDETGVGHDFIVLPFSAGFEPPERLEYTFYMADEWKIDSVTAQGGVEAEIMVEGLPLASALKLRVVSQKQDKLD